MIPTQHIDRDWRFHLGDAPDADFMGYDDRAWHTVHLPHDWAVEHPFDRAHSSGTGYLPGGTSWYRKHLTLTAQDASGHVFLTFQGIYKHARVWVNSYYLGQHAYGYTSFSYDLKGLVREGENVISVRVEHEDTADSRWYTGSGIDRHVDLTVTGNAFLDRDALFVRTSRATSEEALLACTFSVAGGPDAHADIRLLAPEGTVAGESRCPAGIHDITFSVPAPRLWSPDCPSLYTLVCTVYDGTEMSDCLTLPIGIRTFCFDPNTGFSLNGQSMKLRGVCVHHDAGCLGAAVPKVVWARRLSKFKEMGCNALRTAHNPPDPDLLDLCDEMGFLVMDEAFDEWEGTKNKWWQGHNVYPPKHFGYAEDFPQWHRSDLESMIRRDRNHPCVILWSIGNEIDYPNDPYVTPLFREVLGNNDANKPLAERLYDVRKPDASRLPVIARELVDIVHALDTTRPVLSALSFPELSNRTGLADTLDLSGYNYRESFYENDHARYPDRVILGSENSHAPDAWYAVVDHDFIAGQFLWTGIDFLGECKGWPVRISQAGALTLAGMEKPLYAQRRALWTETPYLRIAVGSPDEDHGAWGESFLWQGASGEIRRVSVYTNAREATLYLNGTSLGTRSPCPERSCRITWDVPYEAGTLRAVAEGVEDVLKTPGTAQSMDVIKQVYACDPSIVQLEITLKDAAGSPALDEVLYVQPLGPISLMGIENGQCDDLTPYSVPYRCTLLGKAIVYLRVPTDACPGRVHLFTSGGRTADITL
ncbi:MAG: DUF4982 domain-containing protein [Clostridia bacterium]|nr:DUF4982 domain-containing protein [Clostridia bacterium]